MPRAVRILLVGFIALVVLFAIPDGIFLFVWTMLTGWVPAGGRLWSTLHVDPAYVGLIVVALAAIISGSHYLFEWFIGKCNAGSARHWRWGWTLATQAAFWLIVLAAFSLIAFTHQTGWLLSSNELWFERKGNIQEKVQLRTIAKHMEAIARTNNWNAAELRTAYWQGHREGRDNLRELFEMHDFVLLETNPAVAAFALLPRRPGVWAMISEPGTELRLVSRAKARDFITQAGGAAAAIHGSTK